MLPNAIGLIEFSSIARGIEAADAMLKAAAVELILSRTICSGKFISVVGGDVAAVSASVQAGVETAQEAVIDRFVIPNIHPDIFPAISGTAVVSGLRALGILESFSVASLIEAADAALKAAEVEILEIRLAMAIGGKAYATLTGEVGAVQAAVNAGAALLIEKGTLVGRVVIPAPRDEIVREKL